MKKLVVIFATVGFLAACNQVEEPTFTTQIETAHDKVAFLEKGAVSFDINLSFGGKTRLDGKMTLLTNSSKGLIEEKNGNLVYFDEANIYIDTAMANLESSRFAAYTWSYFFLMPYKLNDGGTKWEAYSDSILNGKSYDVEKLTFEAGTGDAPDDWYIIYKNKDTDLMHVAAYIVTAGRSIKEAEEDPHAIEYADYKKVDGISIAHKWLFHAWREVGGLTEQLGEANLTNIKFITVEDNFFKAPAGFIEG